MRQTRYCGEPLRGILYDLDVESWDLRPHRFESSSGERARIRDTANNKMREIEVASLRAPPSLSADELNARFANQRDMNPPFA